MYVIIFIVDVFERDLAETYHKFETTTGRVLASCRFVLVGYFYWCVSRSYEQESREHVRRFYARLGWIGAAWLLALPLCAAIASYLKAWDQLRVMSGMLFTANVVAVSAIAVNTYPKVSARQGAREQWSHGRRRGRCRSVRAVGRGEMRHK